MRKAYLMMVKGNCGAPKSSKKRRQPKSAFTLIEIMIVVLIIATLLNIALPAMVGARNTSQMNSCIGNLKTIQNAKQEWAIDTNQAGSVTPDWSEISPYVNTASDAQPVCPTSQLPYNLNAVDEAATCPSYPTTHSLSTW